MKVIVWALAAMAVTGSTASAQNLGCEAANYTVQYTCQTTVVCSGADCQAVDISWLIEMNEIVVSSDAVAGDARLTVGNAVGCGVLSFEVTGDRRGNGVFVLRGNDMKTGQRALLMMEPNLGVSLSPLDQGSVGALTGLCERT